MNIEKNFAFGTEKIIIFHCLFQYLQSGLGSHLGQTSPYRRSSGETLNRYSLWRLSPGLGLGLAKCSRVRQFSRARWARCSQFLGGPGLAGLDPRKIFLVQGSLGSRLARSRARAIPGRYYHHDHFVTPILQFITFSTSSSYLLLLNSMTASKLQKYKWK